MGVREDAVKELNVLLRRLAAPNAVDTGGFLSAAVVRRSDDPEVIGGWSLRYLTISLVGS